MVLKSKLFIVFAALITIFSSVAYATDKIYPNDTSGKYSYTYETGIANDEFTVLVIKGLYNQGEVPEFNAASVIYYNVFSTDSTGKLIVEFVPAIYDDATLVLSGHGQGEPIVLCHIMKGTAVDVDDFGFELSKKFVKVDGINRANIKFNVWAKDSFGFDTVLPEYTTYEIVGYTGDEITVSKTGISVGATVQAGTYTVRITCGDIIKEQEFTVEREKSKPTRVIVSVNGNSWYTHYVDCISKANEFMFSPAALEITAVTYDQFGDEISEKYKFKAIKLDENEDPVSTTVLGTGVSMQFIPRAQTYPGETDLYEIEMVSVSKSTLKASVRIEVEGKTNYTGEALSLYSQYIEAKEYMSLVESGKINVSEDGKDVFYEYSWVTPEKYNPLKAAVDTASEVFAQVDSGNTNAKAISDSYKALKSAVSAFSKALRKGLYAPIEDISFESADIDIAIGANIMLKVYVLPQKPSENVVYTSSNPDVVTVSFDGKIVAKAQGDVVITASNADGSIYDECNVHVYKQILDLSWEKSSVQLVAGQSATTELQISPSDHTDELTFTSSDENVVSVDNDGKITAKREGTAKITVQTLAGRKATFNVTVTQPVFSGIDSLRGKPAASFKLPVMIEKSKGIAKLQVEATFDKNIFTFNGVEDAQVLSGFAGTDISVEGTAVSVWNISDAGKDISDKLAKFAFTVAENAPYGTYKIKFDISAFTDDAQEIICENASFETNVVVGESNTYNVTAQAESNGTASGTGNYEYGSSATVTATPNRQYIFSGWYSNGVKVSTDASYTFTVTQDTTLIAKFSKEPPMILGGSDSSSDSSADEDQDKVQTVSPVTASILSGSHVDYGASLVLTSATPGAMIYYTIDGTIPSAASIRYTGPIIIDCNMTIMAVAVKGGMLGSNIATFIYTVKTTDTVSIALKSNAASIKYITAENNNKVRPDEPATRYEVIDMLGKLFDVKGRTVANIGFTDWIPKYKSIIDKYAGAGIINGYPDGTFKGTNGITRSEVSKILCMMLGFDVSKAAGYNATFSDIEGHWAKDHIKVCATMGLVKGYPDGSFKPDSLVTRAEIITILNRITGISKVSGLTENITDLDASHWAFDDIVNITDMKIAG